MRCSHCSHCYHAKKREGEGMHSEREMVDAHYRAWRGCGFCSRAGAVVLPVVCLGACGVLPLCLPWGLMRRAGGAWKVWGAHAGNRPVRLFYACEGFGRGGICADVPPLFQKVPPFVPPPTPGFRHTSAHVHALVKATSHREKEKGRKLVEASGLICGARGRNRTGTPCGGGF